jgi:hypothetical protein
MHRLVMLAGQQEVKDLTDHGWPPAIAIFNELLELPEHMHPQAVRLMHDLQPDLHTPEQLDFSLAHATEVLYGFFNGLCQDHACPSCKADRHCGRDDPIACWCITCDPELDDDTRELMGV